jgi:hypothetical protein
MHGHGAKNTASKQIKSFQGFEGTGKEEKTSYQAHRL